MTMGLWRHAEFLKLWVGQTVSTLGSFVTALALGLTAAGLLRATPLELGVLGMLLSLPFVLFGLPAGVWVDRTRRKPLLIGADIGRALLLASVPAAALVGWLSMTQLYVVAFGVGSLNVIFAVAYGSFLPSLIERIDLQEGNAKLALGEAIARVSGPGLAGVLVQVLTAPVAIAADAVSFLLSAVSLIAIRTPETPLAAADKVDMRAEIGEGIQAVAHHPVLRPLLIGSNLGNLGDGVLFSSNVWLLFLSRDLDFEPATVGSVLSGLGIGGLIGAAISGPLTRRLGPGVTIAGSLAVWALGFGGLAFVYESPSAPLAAAVLIGLVGTINPIAGANVSTLRQALTPDRLLGRVTAVVRVATWGSMAVGALVGGVLAEWVGVRQTVLLSGILPLIGFVWVALSPVRGLRRLDFATPLCSDDS
jgi:MFS family permease